MTGKIVSSSWVDSSSSGNKRLLDVREANKGPTEIREVDKTGGGGDLPPPNLEASPKNVEAAKLSLNDLPGMYVNSSSGSPSLPLRPRSIEVLEYGLSNIPASVLREGRLLRLMRENEGDPLSDVLDRYDIWPGGCDDVG